MKAQPLILAALMTFLCSCSSMYYNTMEKMGVHKRDILVDRVKDARDTQDETKKQFVSAMEQFKSVVNFQGGDLERKYNTLNATLKKSEAGAAAVRERVAAVDDVSKALFREWRGEIKQYSSDTLRRASQKKYDATLEKYDDLITAMRKAESKLEPALAPLRDQVLFMKHNLNAKAIAGLSSEVADVQTNVDQLIKEMEAAIAEADQFIAALKEV
jgi:hypothetical protein